MSAPITRDRSWSWTEKEYPGRNSGRWRQPSGSLVSLAWGRMRHSPALFWACRYLNGHMQQGLLNCPDMEIIALDIEEWAEFERRIGSTPVVIASEPTP